MKMIFSSLAGVSIQQPGPHLSIFVEIAITTSGNSQSQN
jgi:hypothetical protein